MSFNKLRDGRHRRSKLTAESACQMFWDRHNGMTNDEIAERYGVSESAVRECLAGRTWRDETVEVRRELIRLQKAMGHKE